MSERSERFEALLAAARERILVLDGSWGVMIQQMGLTEADFRGTRFADHPATMRGDNDILCLTRPDLVSQLHDAYYEAGADIGETNTFNATSISQADYRAQDAVHDLNVAAARLARASADAWTARTPARPRFVAGAIGPLNRTLSMSSDVNDPGARQVSWEQVYDAYREQARALHEGGVDFFLVETVFDTLNAKAAIKAILDLEDEGLEPLPIWISGTITDRSGRTLSGQTVEAFWASVRHARPFAIGFNCALGADLMRPHVAELSRIADTLVAAYPNAGLPNAFGGYDETPETTAAALSEWARSGLVNILGGCCGTTPEHIARIARAVEGVTPRAIPERAPALRLSGLEAFELA
ncbi:MAG TPA: homocysteine S-methyltransferase family protein [Caulobacteraceae bacterium]|jgi:5-methyltetrahydrofolate--homocysteine methyltransferase|nr:homocysteine S-methyltransferase family protein [Caulobacteraceae bacterium]